MSAIRSALDEMAAVANEELTTEELDADVADLLHVIQRGQVLVAEKIRWMTENGAIGELGYPSATAYLMHRGHLSPGRARRMVADAHAARSAPAASRAWADGRLSTDQARRVFAIAEAVPDVFPDAEEWLVETVEPLSVTETGKALEYWRQSVDGPGDISEESQMMRRGISMSETIGGMLRIDGWMTSTAGQALRAAVEANMAPPRDGDPRTPRQRRHDALEDVPAPFWTAGPRPTWEARSRTSWCSPTSTDMMGVAGGTHETVGGQVGDVETIRRLACDASISRIVLGPDSEVLDVGRKTRVWTAAQRRAIVARDRHCTAEGCEWPPQHCDIHHSDHWADGGETSVDKGRLFCRFHHTQEHSRLAARERAPNYLGVVPSPPPLRLTEKVLVQSRTCLQAANYCPPHAV